MLVSRKPTGTLVLDNLLPGKHLYLLATGTGLAPFMSIIRDPETYERFEKIVLVHGVRKVDELAYADLIAHELPQHDYLGEQVRDQLVYYPTVTREPFRNQGRLTDLIDSGKLCADLGLPPLDPTADRVMICGSPAMLKDMRAVLETPGFTISTGIGHAGRLRDRARVRREVAPSASSFALARLLTVGSAPRHRRRQGTAVARQRRRVEDAGGEARPWRVHGSSPPSGAAATSSTSVIPRPSSRATTAR